MTFDCGPAQPESPSPGYQKALLALWARAANRTRDKSSRHFLQDHFQIRRPELRAATEERSATCVVSSGGPLKRIFGTEVLRIAPDAVNLDRLNNVGIPVLDHHAQVPVDRALGRVRDAWIDNGALMARFTFNQTAPADEAFGMVARGEVSGISAGFHVERWEITDEDGRVFDPEYDHISANADITYTASRWQLLEISIVCVPQDPLAVITSVAGAETRVLPHERGIGPEAAAEVRARMQARYDRAMAAHDGRNQPRRPWQGYSRRPRPYYKVSRFAT
jgi:phage head maturation protease